MRGSTASGACPNVKAARGAEIIRLKEAGKSSREVASPFGDYAVISSFVPPVPAEQVQEISLS
jgi:hypothetical protein